MMHILLLHSSIFDIIFYSQHSVLLKHCNSPLLGRSIYYLISPILSYQFRQCGPVNTLRNGNSGGGRAPLLEQLLSSSPAKPRRPLLRSELTDPRSLWS